MTADPAVLTALALEATLLIAYGLVFDLLIPDVTAPLERRLAVGSGVLLGGMGVLAMMLPVALGLGGSGSHSLLPSMAAGAIILATAGLFLGAIPTLVAAGVMAVAALVAMPSGWAAALALAGGAGLGLAFEDLRRRRGRPAAPAGVELWLLGLAVTLVAVALDGIAAPAGAAADPFALVGVLAVMPLAAVALGRILVFRFQRRTLVRQLGDERRRLRLAVETADLGMFEVDLGTGRLTANARLMEQLGEAAVPRELPLEEVLLRVHPGDRSLIASVIEGYRTDARREHRTEFRSIWPDGTVATILSVGRRVEAAPGAGIRVAGVHIDLTHERDRAMRAAEADTERARLLADSDAARRALLSLVEDLRLAQLTQQETLEQYRALIAHAPVAIFVNRGGVITLVNEACVRLLGRRDASELVGRSPLDIFDPIDHPQVLERIAVLRRERHPVEPVEYTITRPDGMRVTVEASASPFEDHGEISIHAVLRDVTEQRRAAIDLIALNAELEGRVRERTSELENAYRELESFSYSVSHDLRAPLRAITGFSQILERRYRDQLDETGRHYLDNIATAGERMGTLIEDLLGYSRVGRREVRHEPLDVPATVDAVMATLSPRIIEGGASIGIEGEPAVPMGDPTLFQQVMLNLIGNGLTYTRPDVPADVTVRSERVGDHVEVSVEDNGIGIAPEHHERVFEVFARLHTEDEIPGTGIGLAIVRKAARLMEGEVRLESTPGEGSRFILRLMAAPAEVAPEARAVDAPRPADPLDGRAA